MWITQSQPGCSITILEALPNDSLTSFWWEHSQIKHISNDADPQRDQEQSAGQPCASHTLHLSLPGLHLPLTSLASSGSPTRDMRCLTDAVQPGWQSCTCQAFIKRSTISKLMGPCRGAGPLAAAGGLCCGSSQLQKLETAC